MKSSDIIVKNIQREYASVGIMSECVQMRETEGVCVCHVCDRRNKNKNKNKN